MCMHPKWIEPPIFAEMVYFMLCEVILEKKSFLSVNFFAVLLVFSSHNLSKAKLVQSNSSK